ncbi:hypothetical protein BS47DRAFT_649412 [Hydnum rufescens UP504]|uniref:Uncharacterized protein n=1 Tax=Hydnum rufescens UP504 TaxID=1448309 RepID=A0A9P6BAQ2_9AGAM|nr:hypothetical protein BS47DRAFT_649412 [Hydnum rufescens UP504]
MCKIGRVWKRMSVFSCLVSQTRTTRYSSQRGDGVFNSKSSLRDVMTEAALATNSSGTNICRSSSKVGTQCANARASSAQTTRGTPASAISRETPRRLSC